MRGVNKIHVFFLLFVVDNIVQGRRKGFFLFSFTKFIRKTLKKVLKKERIVKEFLVD